MSKEAALRAMREARFSERAAGSTAAPRPARVAPTPARPVARPAKDEVTDTTAPPASTSDALCGHRSMNGRTCTREQGHAAKSHRYS